MKRTRTFGSALLLCFLLTGCAAATAGGGGSSNSDTISREVLATTTLPSLYEVVQRTHPRWLMIRPGSPTELFVFENRTLLGGPGTLRDYTPSAVESVEYMDATEASNKLPGLMSRHVAGAIIIHTLGN